MRNLILIILSVLVLVGCANGKVETLSKEELRQHIEKQYETCIYNFDIIVPKCYTISDIACESESKCGEVVNYISNYYHKNNILLDIVRSTESSDKDSCYELVNIELDDVDYYCL